MNFLSKLSNAGSDLFHGVANTLGLQNNFKGQTPNITLQDFANAIKNSQQGFNTNQNLQGALAQQLLSQSQGQGPSLAGQMLKNATNQNNQAMASQIASQKGISPALAARLSAQQAGMANQEAAGQGALMKTQEQLASEGQLGNLYGQMGSEQLQNQNILQNAQANQNNAINTGSLGAQKLTADAAAQNTDMMGKLWGGAAKGASAAMGVGSLADGGMVPGTPEVQGDSLANDKVPAMLSPGEIVIPRTAAEDPEKAKAFIDAIKGETKKPKKKDLEFSDVLKAHHELKKRVGHLESLIQGA